MDEIQRKKTMQSKRRRKESKNRPLEVQSESMETTTEQQILLFEDLVSEILLRLQVKDLLRFMSVSKHWKTLISSHPFRKLHREKHSSTPPLLIACYYDYKHLGIAPYKTREIQIYKKGTENKTYLVTLDLEGKVFDKVTLPFPSNEFFMKTPSYQSKLLCFTSCDSDNLSYLYNPSTRQSFLLTKPSCFSSPEFQKSYGFAFGYIPSKDEYIMVHLVKLSNGTVRCELLNISISNDNFKLHFNQWRSSIDAVVIRGHFPSPGVFVGGVFYWQVLTRDNNVYSGGFILCFDVEKERFLDLEYPDEVQNLGIGLGSLDNELLFLDCSKTSPILEIWKLSCPDNDKIWSRYWKFDFEKLFGFTRLHERGFRTDIFIFKLKYLKGYKEQPRDEQVSVEMGKFDLENKLPCSTSLAVHTNLFTL